MYLSDNRAVADRVDSWTAYDMPSVGDIRSSRDSGKGDFVSLQLSSGKQTAFVPLLGNQDGPMAAQEHAGPVLEEQTDLTEKQAYDKGFAQGEKDGYELGETRARKIIEKIEGLLAEMVGLKTGLVRHYEKDLLSTILAIAEKVVHTHVAMNDTAVKDNILAALELVAEKREVTLKINPEDFEYVEKLRPELFSGHTHIKSIMITSDPAVTRGGCRLETSNGDVDATIESQLKIIQQSLKEAYME
jgi:flagellar assembly protein FliH